ncbi:hypothetical protein AAE02nite_24850 [Adhaeribacter aerolatus]|uniref:Uncharacterized protein n=1 Tax=Adhaeribacter aerolatus TaxID=670289 RepID=A0A512AYM9_9BACT|nr:hypothetical protein AAE02nite_24850 [Adhaeribacter aerolatus]
MPGVAAADKYLKSLKPTDLKEIKVQTGSGGLAFKVISWFITNAQIFNRVTAKLKINTSWMYYGQIRKRLI